MTPVIESSPSTQDLSDEPQRTDWGGIPVLWAEAPAPFIGALMFRVGRADETLRTSGLTHLVEHLALSKFERGPYDYNGRVEAAIAAFWASGEPDEVVRHLTEVAHGLGDLPLERLESEKRILQAEAGMAANNLDARLMGLRYGPVGYGLVNQAELALDWVKPADVSEWARERFTTDNAVVWLTGRPPESLEGLDLPAGRRIPPPSPEPIPSLELPSYLASGTGGVALSLITERTAAVHAAFQIALERAHGRLRRDAALSYAPGGSYFPLDGRSVHITLNADCKDQDAAGVQKELLSVVYELAEQGPTDEELDRDRVMLARALRDPHWAPPALDVAARDTLMGIESPSRRRLLEEREELTPETVARALAEALPTMLVLAPTNVAQSGPQKLADYAPDNTDPIQGHRHEVTKEWRERGEKGELWVGEEGFSYITADPSEVMSWPFDDCVAGIDQLSGGLTVIGREGSWISIHPQRYEQGETALGEIVQALGEERIVPLSERARELEPSVRRELGDGVGRLVAEVDALPDVLARDEELRAAAEAWRNHKPGLLAVTDRRLLFLFWGADRELFEQPLDAISDVARKGLRAKRLVVTYGDETAEFHGLEPRGRMEEIVEALETFGGSQAENSA